jgi:transcriptional regulator EpsA
MHGIASEEIAPRQEVAGSLLSLAHQSLGLRNESALGNWLQGAVQAFIPHQVVIIAWRDLEQGVLSCQAIGGPSDLQARTAFDQKMHADIRRIFESWLASDQMPIVFNGCEYDMYGTGAACGLAHGVSDQRGRYQCLYVFLGPAALSGLPAQDASRLLLPFIDAGFRQLNCAVQGPNAYPLRGATGQSQPVPQVRTDGTDPAGEKESSLSAREVEVMKWVRMGKTNPEIALILNLSNFTVKNHMRRIYRKLDVLNRAQAVGTMKRMFIGAPSTA